MDSTVGSMPLNGLVDGEIFLLDHHPRDKGPDDRGQADDVGQPGQQHQEPEGIKELQPFLFHSDEQGNVLLQELGGEQGHQAEKETGLQDDLQQGQRLHRTPADDPHQQGQDHEPQDIIDDRGPQHGLDRLEAQPVHVLEDPGRDPDAGGADGGAQKQQDIGARSPGQNQPRDPTAQQQGPGYPQKGHSGGAAAGFPQFLEVDLEPHHKEEQDDPQVGEEAEDPGEIEVLGNVGAQQDAGDLAGSPRRQGGGIQPLLHHVVPAQALAQDLLLQPAHQFIMADDGDHGTAQLVEQRPEDDADHQFAQHLGLLQLAGPEAAHCRGQQDDGEGLKHQGGVVTIAAGRGCGLGRRGLGGSAGGSIDFRGRGAPGQAGPQQHQEENR